MSGELLHANVFWHEGMDRVKELVDVEFCAYLSKLREGSSALGDLEEQ